MKKIISVSLALVLLAGGLVAWDSATPSLGLTKDVAPTQCAFELEVKPETFQLQITSNGTTECVSEPLKPMKVANYVHKGQSTTWLYPELQQKVEIIKNEGYVNVKIENVATKASRGLKVSAPEFTWPTVKGNAYVMPFGEGKYMPSKDLLWRNYLKNSELKGLESLSMQFFGVEKEKVGLVYILENAYNNTLQFSGDHEVEFSVKHAYSPLAKKQDFGYRIYVTPKNIVQMAKTYKQYLVEHQMFKTLAEKAAENPNVEKLYGAAHVYFWDRSVISEDNIKWAGLRSHLPKPQWNYIKTLLSTQVEDGNELAQGFEALEKQNYVDAYTKKTVVKGLNAVLQLKTFYNPAYFEAQDSKSKELIAKGVENLNSVELIKLNKLLLKQALRDFADPVEDWANSKTVEVLSDFKKQGLDHLWIGLDDWKEGFLNPEMVSAANRLGYLIGPYDSYHSIHEPGKEKWDTAQFNDKSLYEKATVSDATGKKITGFQGVGRKLNPTLAMAAVEDRVGGITGTGLAFNSWFLDTDGTGEVYDDYSPEHSTSEAEDIQARLKRMELLQKKWHLVVGTEGGNDFASTTAAFAHGIETPAFSWMDSDMQKNKTSPYYVGRYYSSTNGVPEMFAKPIPLKSHLRQLFISEKYSIPLYKLVYNDSFITTHWWGWGTLKLKDDVTTRMMTEVLYNVPPMYHLDRQEWEAHKDQIVNHTKVWSEFSRMAIRQPMTDYRVLTADRKVQMTAFGDGLKCIANYSDKSFKYGKIDIPKHALLLIEGAQEKIYQPH